MSNVSIVDNKSCYACNSCVLSCPKKCISLIEDKEGFYYPRIQEDLCIDCGICLKKCSTETLKVPDSFKKEFFGVKHNSVAKLKDSSSGALFAGLADYIIENNGIVYGCAYKKDSLDIHQISVFNSSDVNLLKGSKYIYSSTEDTFEEVKKILKDDTNRIILYTGRPCQIAGLYAYLGYIPENLYTADIICHGVPSYKLFSKYLTWLGKKNGGEIIYYGFRDKDVGGWTCGGKTLIKTKTKTKTKTINGSTDPFYSSFLKGDIYRPSCYNCKFANLDLRPGDITMGDFWGVELLYPEFYDKNGVSCCVVNSSKGKELFEKVKSSFSIIEVTADDVIKHNKNLIMPTQRTERRDYIYNDIDNISESKFIKKLRQPLRMRIKRIIISLLPFKLKRNLKRIKDIISRGRK